jgi:hypothetical protein
MADQEVRIDGTGDPGIPYVAFRISKDSFTLSSRSTGGASVTGIYLFLPKRRDFPTTV